MRETCERHPDGRLEGPGPIPAMALAQKERDASLPHVHVHVCVHAGSGETSVCTAGTVCSLLACGSRALIAPGLQWSWVEWMVCPHFPFLLVLRRCL